jgi:hypothetical protein
MLKNQMIFMKRVLSIAIISVVLISGCSGVTGNILKMSSLPSSTTAKDLVPQEIDNYETVDTDSLAANAAAAAVGTVTGLTTTAVSSAYTAAFTEKFVTCYQEKGAVNSNGYYRNDNPIYGGAIMVVDKNQITDPATLWNCVRKAMLPFSIYGKELQPCALKFTIETDYNKFYVVGFGTDTSVCQDICENMISGKTLNYNYDNTRCA